MFKSWKTTVTAILAFLTFSWSQVQTLVDSDALTNPDYSGWIASAIALVGMLFARDNDVTSEQAVPERENEAERALRVERSVNR